MQQHYSSLALCNLKEIWMLVAPFVSKQLECVYKIEALGTP
jgi:hypothetical protein